MSELHLIRNTCLLLLVGIGKSVYSLYSSTISVTPWQENKTRNWVNIAKTKFAFSLTNRFLWIIWNLELHRLAFANVFLKSNNTIRV
jgi:hypothetical protein